MVSVFGGFSGNDTYESVFTTWAIAHGEAVCAFPKGFRVIAPLYPLASGGIAAITRIGRGLPFPPRDVMGSRCDNAFIAINTWSLRTNALASTVKIAYLGWVVLMAGAIAALRAAGRGLTRWEPTALVLLACLPPVWTCVERARSIRTTSWRWDWSWRRPRARCVVRGGPQAH